MPGIICGAELTLTATSPFTTACGLVGKKRCHQWQPQSTATNAMLVPPIGKFTNRLLPVAPTGFATAALPVVNVTLTELVATQYVGCQWKQRSLPYQGRPDSS